MVALRCPRCATIVRLEAGTPPACPQCGFTAPPPAGAPPEAATAAQPREPAPAEPTRPEIVSLSSPPAPRRRLVVAVVAAAALLLAGVGAALVFGGFLGASGGSVTEEQLRAALADFTGAVRGSDPSDEAIGLVGSMVATEEEEIPTGFTADLRLLYDPARDAYEFGYKAGGGGLTIDLAVKQKGRDINYVQGAQTFLGRDEDPSTLPRFGDFENLSGPTSADSLLEESDLVVESKSGVRHHGRAATRFVVHAADAPDEKGEFIVYDGSGRVAFFAFEADGGRAQFEVLYGSEVNIQVTTGHPRTSFSFGDGLFGGSEGGACNTLSAACTIPEGHVQEVKLSEVELRAVESDRSTPLASMRLDAGSTEADGVRLSYEDVDGDGLVSAGDTYSIDASGFLHVQFYDLWADQPAGGPENALPGPSLAFLGLALVGAALGLRRLRAR